MDGYDHRKQGFRPEFAWEACRQGATEAPGSAGRSRGDRSGASRMAIVLGAGSWLTFLVQIAGLLWRGDGWLAVVLSLPMVALWSVAWPLFWLLAIGAAVCSVAFGWP